MPPVHLRRPSTSTSAVGDWDGLTLRRMLQNGARKKFDQGFQASLENDGVRMDLDEMRLIRHARDGEEDREDARFRPPFSRSASVLGLRSPPDQQLSSSVNEKLALDYVDLECLLHEKMREFNVEMPVFKNGRYYTRRERPFERKHDASIDDTEVQDSSHSESKQMGGPISVNYVKSVREAAFLFRLCQQEIKLQINMHCPERARLVEKTLQFYSTVLDYLIGPLEQNKICLDSLNLERLDRIAR
jgi:hypothetical protein